MLFPSGIYITGPFRLQCNNSITHVAAGSIIRSVNTTKGWPLGPDCPEPSQGLTAHQAAPLMLASNVHNITVEGGGMIDGMGSMWWKQHCGNWWCPPGSSSAKPYAFRPFLFRIDSCTDVRVDNITMKDPGFWCLVPVHSQRVAISNVYIVASTTSTVATHTDTAPAPGTSVRATIAHRDELRSKAADNPLGTTASRISWDTPNTDGIEPMWSSDVHIRDCWIQNGDDCITVKSGSRNIYVENVRCEHSHGITIGSVWYDDVVNVTYKNISLFNTAHGPRIKGRRQGNATVRDITFEDITLHDVGSGIQIDMTYETPGSTTSNIGVTAENVWCAPSLARHLLRPWFAAHGHPRKHSHAPYLGLRMPVHPTCIARQRLLSCVCLMLPVSPTS